MRDGTYWVQESTRVSTVLAERKEGTWRVDGHPGTFDDKGMLTFYRIIKKSKRKMTG
jgi:hypothetical protein